MDFFNVSSDINGHQVIGFTSVKELEGSKFVDSSTLASFMMNDDGKSHSKYLGLINLFATTERMSVPVISNLLENAQVLEVEPGQSVTYDLPVSRSSNCAKTIEDTSGENGETPGINETYITAYLSKEFAKGDIITYDFQFGEQLMVSNDHEVQVHGDGFEHKLLYVTKNREAWFPADMLKAGIEYFKVTNVLGEYDTDFSTISSFSAPDGTIRNEFILGDPRGVETFYTAKAANTRSAGLKQMTDQMRDEASKKAEKIGGKDGVFVISKAVRDAEGRLGFTAKGALVGGTMEYLMLAELARMEAYGLNYQRGGTFRTANGSKTINEGLYHQGRRGKIITYSKPGGLTFNHIHNASTYIFKNSGIPVSQRKLKFKVGSMAWANLMQLFSREVNEQLSNMPPQVFGTDSQISGNVLTGPLDALEMRSIAFRTVQVPGIGWISAELDESMDYIPYADRLTKGYYGEGFAHTSHSLIIEDATDPYYSNVMDRTKNAKLVEGGYAYANKYYVKPEGPNVVWGYEQGRMADGAQTSGVRSSLKYMARSAWATSHSEALLLDATRQITIELARKS